METGDGGVDHGLTSDHPKDRMYSCVGTKSATVPPAAKEVMSSAWGGVKCVSASKKAP